MATYKLIGSRFLRKYTAKNLSPAYAAALDAQTVVDEFCNVPWELVNPKTSQFAYHTEEVVDKESGRTGLDENVAIRDSLDAALFCAEHSAGMHRAYAQAMCLRFTLPDDAVGASLSSLKLKVSSDPYNSGGCRVSAFTNSTGEIPTNCNTVRAGSVHADAQVPRTSQTSSGTTYWYAAQGDVTLTPDSAITLQKYLFVFFGLEDYSITRGNWLEGSATLKNLVEITTSADVTGWTDGATYDLSAGDASEYAVVAGGVYPDIRDGYSGVDTIQLQRSGEELARQSSAGSTTGSIGLKKLQYGEILDLFNVPAEQVTCIQELQFCASSKWQNVLVIGGTFDGGTWSNVPGIYFYNLADKKPFRTSSLSASAPAFIFEIATAHGGLAAISAACIDSSYLRRHYMSFIAMDGTTYGGASNALGIAPVAIFTTDTYSDGIELDYHSTISGPVQLNVCTLMGHTGKQIAFSNCFRNVYASSGTIGGSYIAIGILDSNELDIVVLYWYYNSGWTTTATNRTQIAIEGSGVRVCPTKWMDVNDTVNALAVISGDLTSVGGTSCKNIAFLRPATSNFVVDVPDWDDDVTPDTYDEFMVSGYAGPQIVNRLIVTGSFASLGGDRRFAKMASIVAGGAIGRISVPMSDYVPPTIVRITSVEPNTVYFSAPVDYVAPQDYYPNIHDDVTDAQSAIGLRTLYAKLFLGKLTNLAVPELPLTNYQRPGALFVVRGDTVAVPVAAGTTTNLKTWQMTVAKLLVPFAVPTAFRANKIKLDWAALTNATSGARLACWLKRGVALEEYPAIKDPAIFDASKSSVDGWELVGTVSAVGTSTATFELARALDGRVATLMFTAYINLDGLNPSSEMTLPQGVGLANINGVDGTTENLYTGWKPNITLIG